MRNYKNIIVTIFIIVANAYVVNGQNFKVLNQLPIADNNSAFTLQYDRKDYGIGLMDNKGVIKKEQSLTNTPIDFGIMGDNILLLSAETKNIKTIAYTASLITKNTLSIKKQQSLFTKENTNKISATMLKDQSQNFCYLLLRETKYDEGFRFFGPSIFDTKFLQSNSIKLVTLTDNLEEKIIDIKSEAINTYYAGATSDALRNIYLASFTNSTFIVEKFDNTGKLISKLTTPITVWKNPDLTARFKCTNDNNIIVCATYLNSDKENVLLTTKYDFSSNKVYSTGETVLNKEYKKGLKNVNEDASGSNFKIIGDLLPVQIIADDKKAVVIKEIKFSRTGGKGEASIYYREGSIVSIYNLKNFELEKDVVIDKSFGTFVETSSGISGYLTNDYLWLVICKNSGLTGFKTFIYKVNHTTGVIEKNEIEKGAEDIGKGWVTFPSQTAWFKKNFIVPFFKVSSPFSLSFETKFTVNQY